MAEATNTILLAVSSTSVVLSGGVLVALVRGLLALGEFRGQILERLRSLEREVFAINGSRNPNRERGGK